MSIKICLDAGHYGKYNQSPANKSYYESDMNWKLTMLQKKFLEEYKEVEVILTRSNQATDKALCERGKSSIGCNLFISNHSNATGSSVNDNVDYVAVYHLVDDSTTNCDDVSKNIANVLGPVIAQVMETKQGYKVVTRKADSDRNGDGIMNDNYYGVLHGARLVNTPGLILEHSFHTNTRITNWLLVDSNLEKLAKAEVEALAGYYGLKKKEQSPVQYNNSSTGSVLYRVQVGAYSVKENAIEQLNKLKASGFEAIVVQVDGLYKVQVGAYSIKGNADNMVEKLRNKGYDSFITTKSGQTMSVSTTVSSKPVEPVKTIQVGSTVRVKSGAKTYTGGGLASFVYTRDHKVNQINGDRVVITYNGTVVAAVRLNDLILV